MKTIAFIPVRGDSKSIPKKNILDFNGHALVYWACLAAQNCRSVDAIIVATESAEIASTVDAFGFNKVRIYHRSTESAQDTSPTESVLLEYIEAEKPSPETHIALIQATNPFITAHELQKGCDLLLKQAEGSVISCAIFKRFLWDENGKPINYDFMKRPRRQDFSGIFLENGSFYINSVKNIVATGNRLTEPIAIATMAEYSATEIDEFEDWLIAEKIHKKYILDTKQP